MNEIVLKRLLYIVEHCCVLIMECVIRNKWYQRNRVVVLCSQLLPFEKVLSDQFKIVEFFNNIFHDFLCAFRKGHGCQTTLLRPLEDWQSAHDTNCYVAAILKDLAKAFDCLPHDILLSKLAAYKISSQSVKVLEHYLTGASNTSNFRWWSVVPKGP